MNLIESSGEAGSQVELKYCERCGGLFLRALGNRSIYCALCRPRMAAEPAPETAPPAGRRRRPRPEGYRNRVRSIEGVALEVCQ